MGEALAARTEEGGGVSGKDCRIRKGERERDRPEARRMRVEVRIISIEVWNEERRANERKKRRKSKRRSRDLEAVLVGGALRRKMHRRKVYRAGFGRNLAVR